MRIYFDSGVLVSVFKQIDEPFHEQSKALIDSIRSEDHDGQSSELSVVEFAGAFASNTRASLDDITGMLSILQSEYKLRFAGYGAALAESLSVLFEFRELKRKYCIPSADIFHVACAKMLASHFLVSVDKRHLLRDEIRNALKRYVVILNPEELCKILKV